MAQPQHNFTVLVTEVGAVDVGTDDDYDNFMADVWVGVVLTLMILSCVCCVGSCLLYHKFQQWKRSVLESRGAGADLGDVPGSDVESLPSYTIVSGLPTYDEALEQLRQVREHRKTSVKSLSAPDIQRPQPLAKLSVSEFFQMYKTYPPA